MGSFGGKDNQLAGATATLQRVLTTKRIEHDIKEYPEAASHAWNRIEAFFCEQLSADSQ